jgi:hypothetical protein
VLVSSEGRFVFVHVQKTGGTSIESVLTRAYPDARLWLGRHSHARAGQAELGADPWEASFSFAFVRNPWDRLVSWYAMIRNAFDALGPFKRLSPAPFESKLWNYAVRKSSSFDSFLENCTDEMFDLGCYKSFAYNQVDYLTNESGQLIVDFVGRYETLAQDAAQVFERLGVSGGLPELNRSRHAPYRDLYSPRMQKLVEQRFAKDIETFGYTF